MTDLFNPCLLEFLGALEHLSEVRNVIYFAQLLPAWENRDRAIRDRDQISNSQIGFIPLYLSPVLH